MKFFRLTHILFLFIALLLITPFLFSSAHAQSPEGVTPKFNCLGPCPTLPVKQTNQDTNQPSSVPSVSTIAPSNTQTPSSQIATNAEPCGSSSFSSLTNPTTQSPFIAPDQKKSHGSKHNNKQEDRGGFLKSLFQFLLLFIELMIKTGGGSGLAAPCTPTISPAATTSSAPVPSPATPTTPVGSHASANWAGYAINTAPSQGGYVTTNWDITNMPCDEQQKGHASSWPGMGGEGKDPNIAQLGTAEICVTTDLNPKFGPGYYGWTERFPDPVAPLGSNYKVSIGDQFTATITFQGQGKFATTMTNKTKGWTVKMPMSFDASYVPQSSEIITESTDNFPIVPKFDTINYTGNVYSPDGQQKLPLGQAPKLERIINKSSAGVVRTDTSPISGDTFFTNWTHN